MAEVLLTQAVNEAEEAIESGNYGGAIEACQRILGQFPEFAGAHRIMGEAYAEQGDVEAAREAFQRTLERDPQSIPAHLGLGMLSEDAGDRESALAYFQVAWEIDPRRRDLREHVSRISQQVYGADGRLYLTRAALASLHFHAGRWDRAVSEAAQVLQDFSSRIDVQVRLAEALWRRGDDDQAKQVCTTILRSLPSAVVPLLIMADIHRREGDHSTAQDFRKQARDIDPDGVRAADLIMIGFDDQADFLAVESIPTIDDQLVHEEPARYAPAPDFTFSEGDDYPTSETSRPQEEDVVVRSADMEAPEMPDVDPGTVQPFRWEDIGDEDLEISDLEEPAGGFDVAASQTESSAEFSLPTDEEIDQARPSGQEEQGYTGMLESLDSEGMQPFDPTGGGDSPAEPQDTGAAPWDDWTLPTDEEIERARPSDDAPSGYTGELSSLEAEGVQPFDPFAEEGLGETPATPGREPESAPEAEQSTVEPSEEDDWLSEFSLPSEQDIEDARPTDERPAGFTGMLESLESEGVEPFDPFSEQTEPAEAPEAEEAADDVTLEFGEQGEEEPFQLDWSGIDEEIEGAIPGDMPRGYTDELRGLDDSGLEPFSLGDAESPDAGDEIEPSAELEGDGDELDLDQMAAGWESVTQEGDAETPGDELDESADVLFGAEYESQFPGTEPLRYGALQEDVDISDAPEFEEEAGSVEESPYVEPWEPDEGFEELIAAADSLGSEWPQDEVTDEEPTVGPGETSLFGESHEEPESLEAEPVPVARETSQREAGFNLKISPDRLGLDEELIERARQAKQALVVEGRIGGSTPLQETEEVSLDELREAVEHDPSDIDRRITLASQLMKEHPDDALEQFRWVYRNAPDRGIEIVQELARLLDIMREREMGVHRLLGALYRRHGDWAAAALHYEESLSSKRRPLQD